jgi:hypothetical protein
MKAVGPMRITARMAIFALIAMPCHSEGRRDSKQLVTVYVDLRAQIPDETLWEAELLASKMFEKAGVSLHWHRGRPKVYGMEQSITVGIDSDTPPTLHPGAFAYAEPYAEQMKGVHIRVFLDRIENGSTSELLPYLLGHVLVHEITHILEGCDHHSEEGVMKKSWTVHDVVQMAYKPLPFDALDVELIRRGLANRDPAATSARLGNRDVVELAAAQ